MARGKIQIRRIENSTNRQVTYSKRRNGLFKKANELAVLCDAKVLLIMASSSGKVQEFNSPSTTTKQMLDEYQKSEGIDLWSSHYEAMQEHLKKLKEVNRNLRKQIRQRLGAERLNDLNFNELRGLEDDMEGAVDVIRNRKIRVISNQIDTTKKKIRSATQMNRNLREYDARDDPDYGLVENGAMDYNPVFGYSSGGPRIFALRLQNDQCNPNLHSGGGSGSDVTTAYALL